MLRRLAEKSGFVFAIVFTWKVLLLLATAQPVPNNDAFFYDGPVVNFLLNGSYCNPSLVHALPISGGEVFSAYPPLYQAVLLGWMSVFGTSAPSAMWLHVMLLGGFFLIVLDLFRRLQTPALAVNLAGLFLFGITFHDRPDTVAHVFGALGVWALLRGGRFVWLAAAAELLAFCASLQIGAVYFACACLLVLGEVWAGRRSFPWAATLTLCLSLAGLILLVRFGFPQLWAGFQEHLGITPSLTKWRWPDLLGILKACRTAPAIFAVAALMSWALLRKGVKLPDLTGAPLAVLAVSGTIAALMIVLASLTKISPNTVHITNYLQPLVVGSFLGSGIFVRAAVPWGKVLAGLFVTLSLVTGVRAAGMSTWGVICARDFGFAESRNQIRAEINSLPDGSTVIASSAYLYDLAGRTNLHLIHNDWPAAPGEGDWELRAFAARKPARIIVTQFDFYRRFGATIEQLRAHPGVESLTMTNLATVRPPDSFPKFQRMVQHVSWAPVIVNLKWR